MLKKTPYTDKQQQQQNPNFTTTPPPPPPPQNHNKQTKQQQQQQQQTNPKQTPVIPVLPQPGVWDSRQFLVQQQQQKIIRETAESHIYFFSNIHQDCLTFAGRGFLLHMEDGVGPCGPMTLKEEKLMTTPPHTVWVRVDPWLSKRKNSCLPLRRWCGAMWTHTLIRVLSFGFGGSSQNISFL